ncbi:tRNA (adenosine(37)-N6)-dimethylallyltransferase MiaA, partial [Candidatus Bipolaricaulota bacterium]|nr:tRNA (adenosine(37)-N6)-dimethylallyltransferase MiaA [Candidatus Bipolaricaulota bacterium]
MSARDSATRPVVVILGPTAVGKSAVAIEVATRLHGEVISADSRAFFRGLDIVTDKPSLVKQQGIPHHLIDLVAFDGRYDAMAFRNDVARLIPEIEGREHLPIVAGGGTLYLGAILRGIFSGPAADAEIRDALLQESLDSLYARLLEVDPAATTRIHRNDRLRIMRALEVHELTGQPISELQKEAQPLPYPFTVFGLKREREDHRKAIAARVEKMLSSGLIDEVKRLRDEGLHKDCQAYRTIGVRETFEYLDEEISREELREKIIRNTWALARRQAAWFRNDSEVTWVDVTDRT